MNKKIRAIIAIGGTGGHVFPGCCLANHLLEEGFQIKVLTDKRGKKYLHNFKHLNIFLLPSSPLVNTNIISKIFSVFFIIYSVLRAIFFLTFNRPQVIFGMGGYASFPICIAATLLKIKFIIYENNLVIGKANKYLLPFANKILVSYNELEGVPKKHNNKIIKIGNIIKKEILNNKLKNSSSSNIEKINILVLGGSQAAKIFAETLPSIFYECCKKGIQIRVFQHCLPSQNESLKLFYENRNIEYEIFNFSNNLEEYFSKTQLAITRAGSSMLAELTNANIPFISVPLPSSAEDHQLKNAIYYKKKDFGFLIEEKDLNSDLLDFIQQINKNRSILSRIIQNQSQYSDKNVYNNIDLILEKIINEKN